MYLITGTSGHFGKTAAKYYLQHHQGQNLAILSRSADKVKDLTDQGAELRTGDYNDYTSLVKAFQGIEKVLFVSSNDLAKRETHHKNVINAAKEAGVKHLLFTSFQFLSMKEDSPNGLMPVYVETERFLKESGIGYTILRNGIYTELLPDIIGGAIRENRTLLAPAGNTKVAFTSRNDLAEAAARLLISDAPQNTTLDLTNNQAVNFPEIVLLLSQVISTEINYIDPGADAYKQVLTEAGLPAEVVGLLVGIMKSIESGEFTRTSNDLQTILGREPESVETFLRNTYSQS